MQESLPNAVFTDRETVLGTPLGHGVTTEDFAAKALAEFTARISVLQRIRMSFTMRIFTVNCFLLSLFS